MQEYRSGLAESRRRLIGMAGGCAAAAVLAAGIGGAKPAAAADVVSLQATEQASNDALAYWTPARMQAATPLMPTTKAAFVRSRVVRQVPGPSQVVPGAPPTVAPDQSESMQLFTPPAAQPAPANGVNPALVGTGNYPYTVSRLYPRPSNVAYVFPNEVVGKLFFTINGAGFVCSASVIRVRVIATAGHCTSDGNGNFYSNWLFVPAYQNGVAPYKQWTWTQVVTTNNWFNGGGGVPNIQDDALIVLKDQFYHRVLHKIGEVTGYFGFEYNAALPTHISQLGYPCNLDSCQYPTVSQAQLYTGPNNNREWGTAMFGGASGGPQVQDFGQQATGTPAEILGGNIVVSVTSYTYTDPAVQVDGGSIFGAPGQFAGGTFGDLINSVCATPGNC